MIALSYNILLPRSNYSGGRSHHKEIVGAWKLNLQYFPKIPLHIKEVQIFETKRHTRKEKHKLSCWAVEQRMPSALHGMEETDYAGTSIS